MGFHLGLEKISGLVGGKIIGWLTVLLKMLPNLVVASNVINFTIRFWTSDTDLGTSIQARSEAIKAIKETFDKLEIVMVP